MQVQELKELITKYDTAYRLGRSMVSDEVYDGLIDQLIKLIGPDDDFFLSSVKESEQQNKRREQLPVEDGIIMASMEKIKTVDEFLKYLKLKKIPTDVEFIATGKYDGISMLKYENTNLNNVKAWTKGREDSNGNTDGGLRSEKHLNYMGDVHIPLKYTFGEVIFNKENLLKYIEENDEDIDTKSPRNIASGFFRRDDLSDDLHYLDFIRYGYFDENKKFNTKKELLDFLNTYQKVKVPYKVFTLDNLNEDFLKELYNDFSKDYILDGLILEVNDLSIQNQFGRNRSNNPIAAIAFKSKEFDERKTTTVLDIEYNTSKGGNCIPVALLKPVNLGGTEVKRCTLNNASYMQNMGIGIGSEVVLIKSGSIIPLIIEVINTKPFVYPEVEGGVEWDENKVHLRTLIETDEQKIKKLVAFFSIINVKDFSQSTLELIYYSGYKTLKDILNMSLVDFENLDRFGKTKATKLYNEIQSKIKDVPLPVLQHSSSIFKSLGRKKLVLLEHFETKPSVEDIMKIEGFSEILANNYIEGYDKFFEFISDIPVTYTKTKKQEVINDNLKDISFVFTGFRDKDIEDNIEKRGGKISSSISKTTNYLVVKDLSSTSSKISKAESLGIKIINKDEVINLIK